MQLVLCFYKSYCYWHVIGMNNVKKMLISYPQIKQDLDTFELWQQPNLLLLLWISCVPQSHEKRKKNNQFNYPKGTIIRIFTLQSNGRILLSVMSLPAHFRLFHVYFLFIQVFITFLVCWFWLWIRKMPPSHNLHLLDTSSANGLHFWESLPL